MALASILWVAVAVSSQTELALGSPPCNPGFSEIDTVGNLVGGNLALAVADLDSDGDLDVAGGTVSDAGSFYLSWWENHLPASFERHNVDTLWASAVAAGDIDGDGDMDLVCPRFNSLGLYWFENAGDGEFSRRIVDSGVRAGTYDIELVDLDNDQDLDVIAPTFPDNPDSNQIVWSVFANNGTGSFTQHTQAAPYNPNPNPFYIARGDLDNDGDLDVVTPGDTVGPILWWKNIGGLTFTVDSLPGQLDGVGLVTVADLDSDSDDDVIASSYDGELNWWENLGLLSFTIHSMSTEDFREGWVGSADLDHDGDVDLVTDGPFSWWENDGNENFSEHPLPAPPINTGGPILAADLDNDCNLDLVATYGVGGNTIVWWRNECALSLCVCHADPQCDSVVSDIQDVVVTINVAFRGQSPTNDDDCEWDRTDVDCSGATDVLDIVRVINVAFRAAKVGIEYCIPCP